MRDRQMGHPPKLLNSFTRLLRVSLVKNLRIDNRPHTFRKLQSSDYLDESSLGDLAQDWTTMLTLHTKTTKQSTKMTVEPTAGCVYAYYSLTLFIPLTGTPRNDSTLISHYRQLLYLTNNGMKWFIHYRDQILKFSVDFRLPTHG